MRLRAAVCATIATLVADTPPAGAHALTGVLVAREAQQKRTLWRDHGTIRFFARRPWLARMTTGRRALRFARAEIRWTTRELGETRAALRRARQPIVDGCLSTLIYRESRWNVHATNSQTGAYGLPQALPGSRMASAGPDWRDNAATQIRWMLSYVNGRYGSSCAALSFQIANGWY